MGYFLLNHFHKYQLAKVFLLGMSLWFYSYFNVKYLPVILLSIGLNYLAGIFLLREGPGKAVRRLVFLSALLVNIGALFYFKYFDFFLENLNTALKTDFSPSSSLRFSLTAIAGMCRNILFWIMRCLLLFFLKFYRGRLRSTAR